MLSKMRGIGGIGPLLAGADLCGWRLFADGFLGLCRQVSHKSADFASEMGAEVPPQTRG